MGNTIPCDKNTPTYENICNNPGDITGSPGFCTISGPAGDSYRRDYCENLGGSGEFSYAGQGGSCHYNSQNKKSSMGSCCSGSACGIIGNAARCRRRAYNADPLLCCNRDLSCNKDEQFCFSDSTETKTCDPRYRDMASPECGQLMIDYCTGSDVPIGNTQEWVNRWVTNVNISGQTFNSPCYDSIYRNLYSGQVAACAKPPIPNSGVPSTAGYLYAQELMYRMIQRYIADGGDLASIESSETNAQLNDLISKICTTTPGLCTRALNSYCVNINSNTLVRNPEYLKWCGCYMSQENYSKYTNLYGVSRECTPTCNMEGVIPLATSDGTSFLRCSQNLCIIDDISISIAQSTVSGNINFSQICNSCTSEGSSGTCNCSITGGNFTIIDSKIGNIEVSQQCSADSSCYREIQNPDGTVETIKTSCTGGIDEKNEIDEIALIEAATKTNYDNAIFRRNMIILGILLLLIILMIVFWAIFYPPETVDEDTEIHEENINPIEKEVTTQVPVTKPVSVTGTNYISNEDLNKIFKTQ